MAFRYRPPPGSRDPPVKSAAKTTLSRTEQRLIEMAHDVRYGSLPNIAVRNGELQFGAKLKARTKHRLGKPDQGRSTLPVRRNFLLKSHHRDLIERIRRIKEGIVSIDIEDGLPVKLVVEEEIGV